MAFLAKIFALEKVATKLLFCEFNSHLTQKLNLSTKTDEGSCSDEIYINPNYVNKNPRFI